MVTPQRHPRPKRYRSSLQKSPRRFDLVVLGIVVTLTLVGLLMVYDASIVEAYRDFSDKYHFAKLQALWALIGFASLFVSSLIPLSLIKKLALPFFILSITLLIIVLIPAFGSEVQGARRWIALGSFTLQPSEVVKLGFALYLASWLEKRREFVPFVILSGLILGLMMAQPDLGTTVVLMGTGVVMYFLSGAPIAALVALLVAGFASGLGLILSSAYRKERLLTFLNPTSDPLGASYHIRQVLIALGSGGLLGVGVGRSRQKYAYLPEATTDSIFAVLAEEVGFVGSLIVIALFLWFIYRGFRIAKNAKTPFNQLLAAGITTWVGFQALLNLAAMVALVPLTGIPLPFISYGGSSLVTVLTATGILLNISSHDT
ncbi:MAG: putative lipid II flippase FtsW [Candidatus Chisholmbacteria bacterium]|nr:putative lipid II flippase FtsW [Candidatus Chisholmbacteria bacterium]